MCAMGVRCVYKYYVWFTRLSARVYDYHCIFVLILFAAIRLPPSPSPKCMYAPLCRRRIRALPHLRIVIFLLRSASEFPSFESNRRVYLSYEWPEDQFGFCKTLFVEDAGTSTCTNLGLLYLAMVLSRRFRMECMKILDFAIKIIYFYFK